MIDTLQLQHQLFDLIKSKLKPNQSLVDEVADLLSVSNDSAYRRIRGEKLLDIVETAKISQHYKISLDDLVGLQSNAVNFQFNCVDRENFRFTKYLEYVLNQLDLISGFENKQLLYGAKDIPYFHYFQIPELAYFKSYIWMKLILEYPEYSSLKFSVKNMPEEILQLTGRIWKAYMKVPSTEIWSNETINVTMSQIEYSWECGLFENPEDGLLICEKMQNLLDHIQAQAAIGNKFHFNSEATREGAEFKLYINEVTISDNTILFQMNNQLHAFISHNLFNVLSTSNSRFCDQTEKYFQNIIRKSTLISQVGEKERVIFFRKVNDKMAALKKKINNSLSS